MATNGNHVRRPTGDNVLPDEEAAIAERLSDLDDEESHLSVEEVADDLGIDLG